MSTTTEEGKQRAGDYEAWLTAEAEYLAAKVAAEGSHDAILVAAAIRAGFAELANVTKFAAFYKAKGRS